jgi:hypothetical protein
MYPKLLQDWFPFDAKSCVSKRVVGTNEAIQDFVSIKPLGHYMKIISLPHFRNLRRLVLYPVEDFRSGMNGCGELLDRLADVLVSSPRLESLTLICEQYNYMRIHGINKLARRYALKIKESGACRLQLKELELGPEFIPCPQEYRPPSMVPERGYDANPISQLTDLSYLRRLTLRTEALLYPQYKEVRSYRLDQTCFYPAINLEHLSVATNHSAVNELVGHLCGLDEVKLTSFQDEQFQSILRRLATAKYYPWASAPYSTFHHWETLDLGEIFIIGDTKESQKRLLNSLLQCVHLKTLTISLPGSILEYFRKSVLPRMKSLENLFIPSGPFDKGIPFVARNTTSELDRVNCNVATEKYLEKRRQKLEEQHRTNEEARRVVARALFESGKPNQHRTTRLKYIGLGYRVYTGLFTRTSHGGKDSWQLFELSLDEAKTFEPIREMLKLPFQLTRRDLGHMQLQETIPYGAWIHKGQESGDVYLNPEFAQYRRPVRVYKYITANMSG